MRRPLVLLENGTHLSAPPEVAELLVETFAIKSNGTSGDQQFMAHKVQSEAVPVVFSTDNSPTYYNHPFSISELSLALSSSSSRAPGIDRIPYSFLHQLSHPQRLTLLHFFNYIFQTGYLSQWHVGIISPILKPSLTTTDKYSYRPITLIDCLSKILGKMVNRRLQAFLEQQAFYCPTQSGFRAGHSTFDGLSRLEFDARQAMLMGRYCVAVFLDIARAFDTVWHHGLLLKLHSLGLSGKLARFLQGFLSSRQICVRVQAATSTLRPLFSGVPQGSVLSPTLFTIFINDIFANVDPAVRTSLYADDGALWTSAPTLPAAVAIMNQALHVVATWSHSWGLRISTTKTSAIIFTNKRYPTPPPPLLFDASPLPYVPSVCFLGVTFDQRLTWGPHILQLRDRCRSDIRLLTVIASQRWGADYTTLRRLYTSLILSKLDYGSFLYASAAPSLLLHLDRIQYAACRIILGALRCTPVYKLEAEADLMPLATRRRQLLSLYGCRVLSIPSHPVRQILLYYFPIQDFLSTSYCLPALGRLADEFAFLHLTTSCFPTSPMFLRYRTLTLPVFFSLAGTDKNSLSSSQWFSLFHNLASHYSCRTAVFTDGSKSVDGCGCAVWCGAFTLFSHLPFSSSSVFTAELFAIYSALKFLQNIDGQYILYSDSLSCIRALQSLAPSSHYLISKIVSLLLSLPSHKVVIESVSSHVGIPGNDRADHLARTAITHPHITNLAHITPELRPVIMSSYYQLWSDYWTSLPLPLRSFKPSLMPTAFTDIPRSTQVGLTRLRLGVCLFTHRHLFSHLPRMTCFRCLCPVTIEHMLLLCPSYVGPRLKLREVCQRLRLTFDVPSLLSPPFPAECLLGYLQATPYLSLL